MENLLNEMAPVVQQLWAEAKWLGLLGAACFFAIRIFRLDVIQAKISARMDWLCWQAWPQWLKWAAPIVLAAAGSLAWKLGAGLSWGAAIAFAVTSAGASIFGHKVTKKIGEVEGMRRGPDYEPSKLRRLSSVVIPVVGPPR